MAADYICYPVKSLNPQTNPFTAIYAHCAPIKHPEQVPTPINNPVTAATLQRNVSYRGSVTFSWSLVLQIQLTNATFQEWVLQWWKELYTEARQQPSKHWLCWFTGAGDCIEWHCSCAVTDSQASCHPAGNKGCCLPLQHRTAEM